MAKKAVKKKPVKKVVAAKASPAKKAAAKKVATKKVVKKVVRKTPPPAAKKASETTRPAKPAGDSLGRPMVTAEEKLYFLFREDYHARQVFEFLRVETVGELERFSPQEIIHILSTPIRRTVDSIRKRLAREKRHLRDDVEFARKFRDSEPSPKPS
ncbi:MAG: hypothetical protein IT428_15870 [Planctomycetaceae bacterium]|nr:hypothetical protein [Planctomycetaceae bacterium]